MAEVYGSKDNAVQIRTAGIAENAILKGEAVGPGTSDSLCDGIAADDAALVFGIAVKDFAAGEVVSVVAHGEVFALDVAGTLAVGDAVMAAGSGGTGKGVMIDAGSGNAIGIVKKIADSPAANDLILIEANVVLAL